MRKVAKIRWLKDAVLWGSLLLGSACAAGQPPAPLTPPKISASGALSPAAQKELESFLADEFCPCGSPHGLGQCQKSHACPHAQREIRFAQAAAEAGASASEISASLGRYYASFAKPRAALKVDERQCRGPATAKVTLVEFSDFQCPFCGAVRPLLEAFAQAHPDAVRLCYAPFPLKNHPQAVPAAQTALFARDQGKFWPMHDAIFENQADLSLPTLKKLASRFGLNVAALEKVLASDKYQGELSAYKEAGRAAAVDSTPSLYFNGRKHLLPMDELSLNQSLEDELEWSAQGGWAKE